MTYAELLRVYQCLSQCAQAVGGICNFIYPASSLRSSSQRILITTASTQVAGRRQLHVRPEPVNRGVDPTEDSQGSASTRYQALNATCSILYPSWEIDKFFCIPQYG